MELSEDECYNRLGNNVKSTGLIKVWFSMRGRNGRIYPKSWSWEIRLTPSLQIVPGTNWRNASAFTTASVNSTHRRPPYYHWKKKTSRLTSPTVINMLSRNVCSNEKITLTALIRWKSVAESNHGFWICCKKKSEAKTIIIVSPLSS